MAFLYWNNSVVEASNQPPTWISMENGSEVGCASVHDVNRSERCAFVTSQEDCQIQGGYIDYIRLPYCHLNGYVAAGVIIFALWLTFIFINMAMTVRDFLCPSLNCISVVLRLSENVAGVTFLAFGNGAADIFSLIVLMIKEDKDGSYAQTAMGSILGGGLFVVSVVAGAICFTYKLKVYPVFFVRDVGFYLAAVAWLTAMIGDGKIQVGEAIGFVSLYVLYVLCVVVANQWEKRQQNAEETSPLIPRDESRSSSHGSTEETSFATNQTSGSLVVDSTKKVDFDNASMASLSRDAEENKSTKQTAYEEDKNGTCKRQCMELCKVVWPYTITEIRSQRWYSIVLLIVEAPLRIFMTLTIPVVDNREGSRRNWNRLLIMCNILLGPALATYAFEGFFYELTGHVYIGMIVCGVSMLVALAVACTSYVDHPPPYQWMFAFLGFVMSITWIYILANEVVNVLEACGIILQITGAVLGLIVLAGGNSVCDLVANFVVAKEGKPMMGFAASYGSPLLNMLIGVGIGSLAAVAASGGSYPVELSQQLIVAIAVLLFSLSAAVVMVMLRQFTAHRLLGVTLIASYAVFFVVLLAVEFS